MHAAKLLVLWSFLDHNDLWYGLFKGISRSGSTMKVLLQNLGDAASNEMFFVDAMGLLRDYSLIESSGDAGGYVMHTVVHRWVYLYHGMKHRLALELLAFIVVGLAVPMSNERDYARIQQRLLPHANMCSARVTDVEEAMARKEQHSNGMMLQFSGVASSDKWGAIHKLGPLYYNQDQLDEAEKMLFRALQGYEKAVGAEHTSTLQTVNNLGALYYNQGKHCHW